MVGAKCEHNGIGEKLSSLSSGERLRSYTAGKAAREELCYEDWVKPILESGGELALKIPSGEGYHYVTKSTEEDLVAVHGGPHGPENRPAPIRKEAVKELIRAASDVQVEEIKDTPLTDAAVVDLL